MRRTAGETRHWGCCGLVGAIPKRHAQRLALILRRPARGLEGRGRVAAVASPVLRGFALWATHLRMRLERGCAGPPAPHPAAATFSPFYGEKGLSRDLSVPLQCLAWHVPSPRFYGERVRVRGNFGFHFLTSVCPPRTKTDLPHATIRRMSFQSRKAIASLDPLSGGVNRWTNGSSRRSSTRQPCASAMVRPAPPRNQCLTEIRPHREPSAHSVGAARSRRPGTHP